MQSGSTPQVHDYFSDVQPPDTTQMQLRLEELVQQGVLTPEQAKAELANPSDMNNISTDPKLKSAQMEALQGLQDINEGGGLTAMDRSKLQQIGTDEATSAKGARDAIVSNANARGMGGSGLELMAQLQNQQDSTSRKSQRDLDVASLAQQRALQALMQQGQLAGSIQGQDFNQKAQVAGANDAISKFNAENKQQVNLSNTQTNNNAQATNLAAKQGVADANTATRNTQQQYNKQLAQQSYENELKKRGGQGGVAATNANISGQNSQNIANANNQGISTVAGIFSGAIPKGKKYGGLVMDGTDGDTDDVPTMLAKGEMVIPADQVADFMKKAHTDEDGEFDAGAFLDSILGNKKRGA